MHIITITNQETFITSWKYIFALINKFGLDAVIVFLF
jgi:hypothetical protein